MSDNLTTQTSRTAPHLLTPPRILTCDLSDAIARAAMALTRASQGDPWRLPVSHAPDDRTRARLVERRQYLEYAMQPASQNEIQFSVAQLFLRFPSLANAPDQGARIVAYANDLFGFPIWAVNAAGQKFRGIFPPSSPEFVALVKEEMHGAQKESANLRKILSAEVFEDMTESLDTYRRKALAAKLMQRFNNGRCNVSTDNEPAAKGA